MPFENLVREGVYGCTGFTFSPKYFWKPLTCGYVAAGAFFSTKKGTIFLEAPNLWVRCRRRFFPPDKRGSFFLPSATRVRVVYESTNDVD